VSFRFDPLNPFPLVTAGTISYALQKEHAEAADHYFGYEIEKVEAKLKQETSQDEKSAQWIGLDPQSLQTPYTELRWMLSVLNLKPGQTIVDLGAGYGRMGLVMHTHYPDCNFVGIEIAKTRVDEGNRVFKNHQAMHAILLHADVASENFEIPDAEVYFIYDLSRLKTIKLVIDRLKERSRKKSICVIGRGRATRDQIERNEPWLSQMVEPKYFSNFTVYRS
jgi:hypothetical protein